MHKKPRSLLALLLAVCLCLGAAPSAAAAGGANTDAAEPAEEPAGGLLEGLIRQSFGSTGVYGPDDVVTVVVELEAGALLDAPAENGAGVRTIGGENMLIAQRQLLRQQDTVKAAVSALDASADFSDSESYTVLLNAFTVTVPYGRIGEIRRLPGVKRAFVSGSFSVPVLEPGIETHTAYSGDMIGLPAADGASFTGKGTVIAILDTGIQYDHEAFANVPEGGRYDEASLGALLAEKADAFRARLNDGWGPEGEIFRNITVNDVWHSGKIIYSFDYGNTDTDATADFDDHGVHVSGIAAGHTVRDGETTFRGVAPDAQLAIMKVFNSYTGQCDAATLLSALEDCVLLDVDAINMSLGTAAGFDVDVTGVLSEVLEKVRNAGIFLAVSAGNEGHTAYANPANEKHLPRSENPDFGLVASPSTYAGALSVASVNNTQRLTPYLLLNDRQVPFVDTGTGAQAITSLEGTPELAAVPGLGAATDYEGINVAGKVALIRRGELDFEEKIANAASHGAVAALVFNNEDNDELLGMSIENFYIPSAFITHADGEYALSLLEDGGTVTLDASLDSAEWDTYEGAGEMSEFSSWGPGGTLTIKPEITAPGGNIYSSVSGGRYDSYSGTSMASPHVAGAGALLAQYLAEEHSEIARVDRARLIQELMMSTADLVLTDSGVPAPVRQQGAGLLDLAGALSTGAVLRSEDGGLPKAELGDSEDGLYRFTFLVDNMSNRPLTYVLGANVQTETPEEDGGHVYFSTRPQDITERADVELSAQGGIAMGDVDGNGTVDSADAWYLLRHLSQTETLTAAALCAADVDGDGTVSREDAVGILRSAAGIEDIPGVCLVVPAGESIPVSVTVRLDPDVREELLAAFTKGVYIEGFVSLTSCDEDGADLGLPYLGFLGDWADQEMFDGTFFDGQDPLVAESGIIALNAVGEGNYLGFNYFTQTFDPDRIFFGPDAFDSRDRWSVYETYLSAEVSLLRNALDVTFTLTDEEGNTVYTTDLGPAPKTCFLSGSTRHAYVMDPTYSTGTAITWPEDGTRMTYTVTASPEADLDSTYTLSFPVTVDSTLPEFTSEVRYNEETSHFELVLTMRDNNFVQGAVICGIQEDQWGNRTYLEIADVSGEGIIDAGAGEAVTEVVDLSELQEWLTEAGCLLNEIQIQVVDYAWNVCTGDVELTGGHFVTGDAGDGAVTIVDYQGLSSVLVIPEELDGRTVTGIGPGAFRDAQLTTVTLPDTLVSVGEGAFRGNPMTYVEIPDGVEEIGEMAFGYDAEGGKIPGFTMRVAENSAASAYALENGFAVEYRAASGLIYSINEDNSAVILAYTGAEGTLDIPAQLQGADVTEIGYRAFLDNGVITGVTLPETLTKIGDRAFMNTAIAEVDIPEGVTVIEEGAFAGMTNLTQIDVPAGVTSLPYMVFANDTALKSVTLHEGLTAIGDDVFMNTALTSVDLPDTVVTLGQNCFARCRSLKEISFSSALTTIGSSAFSFTGIETLVLPEGIVSIGGNAFSDCGSLVSVHIPSTLTALGDLYSGAFSSCQKLTTVTFADGGKPLTISQMAFAYCTSLAEFEVPDRCVSIGIMAFSGCTALTKFEVPAGCTTVGMMAFSGCTALSDLTLNEGLLTIESSAFQGCGFRTVLVPASVTSIGPTALGYLDYVNKLTGFTIQGYADSEAQRYAEANGFEFALIP